MIRADGVWRQELVLGGILLAGLAVAEYLLPGFLELRTQLFLSRHLWELALVAVGMTCVMITGGVDLSVGSTVGLCAVAFGLAWERTGQLSVAAGACLATGLLAGALNGALVARFAVHPLIVTLATLAAFRGLAEGISQGESYSQFGDSFSQWARGTWLGIPWPGLLFLGLAAAAAVMLGKTPVGRYLYAVGLNERAARFAGVPVAGVLWSVYAGSGLLSGLAALVFASRFDTAKADVGTGLELEVITAVVLGGTSIHGGRGTMVGTALGLVCVHELRQFVGRYWGVDEWKPILVGILLVLSMLASRLQARRRAA